jgi:hypothetical protein
MTRPGAYPTCWRLEAVLGFRVCEVEAAPREPYLLVPSSTSPYLWLYYGRHGHRLLLGVDWLGVPELPCGLKRQKIG